MFINIKKNWQLSENQTTAKNLYKTRREVIKSIGMGLMASAGVASGLVGFGGEVSAKPLDYKRSSYDPGEAKTSHNAVTGYNNFYEFGTGKEDPAKYAHALTTDPWTIEVAGEVKHQGSYSVDDLISPSQLEERIYRMRCVEAWSMVIPWLGVPLADVIKRLEPTSRAKYVLFHTAVRHGEMPGIWRPVLSWPYVEGLRMDEAMNPLTLLSTGLYGEKLLGQNGAPIRLVVPWKYGFKGIKSIVKISFVEKQPNTSWEKSASNEYGFFANVNPNVSHPRWSQASERRIGEFRRRPTLMYNGYGDEVAHMYSGMDLSKYY
jgi:sulfoxide reductase catalytic subunit YedY